MTLQQAPEIGRRKRGGIDNEIGPLAQGRNALAFEADPVADLTIAGERVASPGFGIAAAQQFVLAIEEDDAQIDAALADQRVERGEQRGGAEVARPDIDADGQRRARGGGAARELWAARGAPGCGPPLA